MKQEYTTCPQCGKRTTFNPYEQPLCNALAESRVRHAEFERRYAKREEEREREGRLSPEAQGRLEARKLIETTHELEAQVANG